MKILFFIITVFVMSGCTPFYLDKENADKIEIGSSHKEVLSLLGSEPLKEYKVKVSKKEYVVHLYKFITLQNEINSLDCGEYGCDDVVYVQKLSTPYLLIYEEDILIRKGFLSELLSRKYRTIRAISVFVAKKLLNEVQ
ncbi:MAG: hypothetical protein OEY68_08140 [Gammaproteobacteria bacterium]|nr:hypothetical protein [Gammaproteobacteria bacterium]